MECPTCNAIVNPDGFMVHVIHTHPEFFAAMTGIFAPPPIQLLTVHTLERDLDIIVGNMNRTLAINDFDDDYDYEYNNYAYNEYNEYEELLNLCDNLGYHIVGVKDINAVAPLEEYIERTNNHIEKEQSEQNNVQQPAFDCPICMDSKQHLRRPICCKQPVCSDCAEKWFAENKRCLLCNRDVTDALAAMQNV